MIKLRRHSNTALLYFLLVGLLGVFLRLFFVTSIPANFRYVVHAHSHIALLGWVYISLTTLIYKMYFTEINQSKTYHKIFWFTQITLVGMLCTFPFTGYALFSIIFSTLFLFASYWMAWFVLKKTPQHFRRQNSFKCIRASLWYLVFSSLGPWAVGGVMATLGKTSIWYKISIYFYLHFQYNAWFIFALCGILFFFLEKRNITFQKRDFKTFFLLLNAGVILSFFLSILWIQPHWIFYVLAGIGAVLQAVAFVLFFKILKGSWKKSILPFSPFQQVLLKIAASLLVVKVLMQLVSAIPYFADLAFNNVDFVIGYLHLTFLGVVSVSLFAFLGAAQLLRLQKWLFWIYFTGFILSELIIFYKGTAMWLRLPLFAEYFKILVIVSSLIPFSVALLLFINILKTYRTES